MSKSTSRKGCADDSSAQRYITRLPKFGHISEVHGQIL